MDTWSIRTRLALRRNAILGSLRFQRWAARLPLINMIARRKAAAQFDLTAGFVYSQILAAFEDADLFTLLAAGPMSETDIAQRTALSQAATRRLLVAAASLHLAQQCQPGLWILGEVGAAMAPHTGVRAMVRHHHLLYSDLADPLALLRKDRASETHLSAFWTYAARGDLAAAGETNSYSQLMAATQHMVTEQVLQSYDFTRYRAMLDVGGGRGAFARAVAGSAPALSLGLFDLPSVIDGTRVALSTDDDAPAITLHSGSFITDQVPSGYDLITLIRIVHDHDDDVARLLLKRVYDALPAGGTLLIAEPMSSGEAENRVGDAYFGLYLWAMGSGRARTPSELTAMLRDAGFVKIRRIKTAQPVISSMIIAVR
jgi:demethylspheroidene O-methyltransferase